MKLVNNLLSFGSRVATLEVVAMGRKLGLPLAAIADAINKGPARSRTSRSTLQGLADGNLVPSTFTLALMLKDLGQAIELGMECGVPTMLTNVARGLVQIGVNTLGANAQLDELLGLIESMAATRFVDPCASGAANPAVAVPRAKDGSPLRVGYVGLGAMGGALARRMMLARKLRVFDARPEVVRAFETEGAERSADLPSLARECDVIFVCLPTSAIVHEVIFGNGGLAGGLSDGKIIVDQTTGDPSLTRSMAVDLEQLGVALIDAPVTGGPRGAVAGTITIMAGGPANAFATMRPVLESVSPNIVYFGQSGSGHIAKLISNAVSTCNVLLTYEAASIAVKCGLKLADVAKVINSGGGWSAATERILPTLSEGKATADFQMQLMVKDLKLVGRVAIECGAPILVARTVCSLYETGLQRFGGSANIDSMARLFESMSGVSFSGA
jgi:3-hydroxyisobutyrate dehydrogenase